MGSSKKQTVSWWFRPVFQLVLHEGPFDRLLAIRGGDVTAWQGEVTATGAVPVSAGHIWGGPDKEGGIEGTFEIMFGERGGQPNEFFQTAVGPDPSGHNGYAILQFNGGRYGAGNPYPKPLAVLTERILQGWENDIPWFPETAPVRLGSSIFSVASRLYVALDVSGSMNGTKLAVLKQAMGLVFDALEAWQADTRLGLDIMLVAFSGGSTSITRLNASGADFVALRAFVDGLAAGGGTSAPAAFGGVPEYFASSARNNVCVCVSDGSMSDTSAALSLIRDTVEQAAISMRGVGIETEGSLSQFDNSGGRVPVVSGSNVDELAAVILAALQAGGDLLGMNPAHVIYDSLTSLQGEPVGTIDDASFRAAAERLHAEGFGICTRYNHGTETIEQFRQRILDLIGAECSRYNGKWYLDLIRELSPEEIAELPVLTDDDILEWQEDPSTRDDAVNQMAVRWFDPITKQSRLTAQMHALAAINTLGTVNAEVRDYPEVPDERLANRVCLRDLRNKSVPTRRFPLTTNRTPYSWRKASAFRLQAPKRGIADMVCRVGEIDRGTLQSGAIRLVAVQDTFAMPATAYVVGQPPVLPPSPVPDPIAHQVLFEAPYVELAGMLPSSELAALRETTAFLQSVGARPARGAGYQLDVALAGNDFDVGGTFDWCPTAQLVEAAGLDDRSFTLTSMSLLDRVDVGTAALWDDEIVRVDAIDPATGACTLARGCADTVGQEHAEGSRIWFYDSWTGSDNVEYLAGETVQAKLRSYLGGSVLPANLATPASLTLVGRQALPYPPARPRINGVDPGDPVTGKFVVTWAHRDRLLQADQLVDQEAASVGPEPTTRYALRLLDDADTLLVAKLDIDGTTATVDLAYTGDVTLQLYAISDNGPSWQQHVRTFAYTADAATEHTIDAPTYDPEENVTIIDGGEVAP